MQVRGKKNLVISQDLAGPVGLFVKFSLLQEYGVDRVFLLENGNVDSTQRNVVFLAHAEKIRQVRAVAGMSFLPDHHLLPSVVNSFLCVVAFVAELFLYTLWDKQ